MSKKLRMTMKTAMTLEEGIAEFYLNCEAHNLRSGMANAKGVKLGRPQVTSDDRPVDFLRHYSSYKADKLNLSELA